MSRREKIRKIMHLVNTSYKKSIDTEDEYHLFRSLVFEEVLENLNTNALDELVEGIPVVFDC
tara:strand:- start:854 stop:1039 length:186 start_codon:yes stop_codon:yes gene_type:complete